MTRIHPPPPQGFALISALLGVVIVSALITATLFHVAQNADLARAGTLHHHALTSAERAAWLALTNTDIAALHAAPVGAVIATESPAVDPRTQVLTRVTLIKVQPALVWLLATASASAGRHEAHHRVGLSAAIPRDSTSLALQPLPSRAWVDVY
jgi:hypothetical protein